MFNPNLVPQNIQQFLEVLKQCTPEDMSALKARLFLSEESALSLTISFKEFLEISAYPLQSYPMSSAEKFDLLLEIQRVFPRPQDSKAIAEYDFTRNRLMQVMKRIKPGESIPVGLDVLLPLENPPPFDLYMKALLGGEIISEGKSYTITGYKESFKCSPEERWEDIIFGLPAAKVWSDEELAVTYQSILNLIYVEALNVKKTWQLEEAHAVGEQQIKAFYGGNDTSFIRINAFIETNSRKPYNEENENDFAFALQYNKIFEKLADLFHGKANVQRRALIDLYTNLQKFYETTKNERAFDLLKFIRKEMAVYEIKSHASDYQKFLQEYHANPVITQFCSAMEEDRIAPFNSILIKEFKRASKEMVQEIFEFRFPMGINKQVRANRRAVCAIYSEVAADQQKFYSAIYQKLHALIRTKRSREWFKYLKFLVPHTGLDEALPAQLPEIGLPEFDLSPKLLKELESYKVNEVSAILPPVAAKPIKKTKRAIIASKVSVRDAQEQSSRAEESFIGDEVVNPQESLPNLNDLDCLPEEDQNGNMVEVEEVKPKIEPLIRPIQLPNLPQPFIYAARVLRWFNAGDEPLDPQVFPEYAQATVAFQKLMLAFHAFTCSVDFFIKDLALKDIWKNSKTGHEDTRYILPAEIYLPEQNKNVRGVITYCVGKDGKLYHRFFSERSTEEIIQHALNKTFGKMAVLNAEETSSEPLCKPTKMTLPSPDEGESISEHCFLRTITIKGRNGGLTLFPISSGDSSQEESKAPSPK